MKMKFTLVVVTLIRLFTMSSIEQNSIDEKKENDGLLPSQSVLRIEKRCICPDYKHVCICSSSKPSISKPEQDFGGNSCRSYDCFKNNYAKCKLKMKNPK